MLITLTGSSHEGQKSSIEDLIKGKNGAYVINGTCAIGRRGVGSITVKGEALTVFSNRACYGLYIEATVVKQGGSYTLAKFREVDLVKEKHQVIKRYKNPSGGYSALLENGNTIDLSEIRGESKILKIGNRYVQY